LTTVNFFWRGKHTFGFFQQIVIESHIKVGHKPIFWLSGEMPEGENWEKIEKKVTVKTTDNLFFNEDEFARDSIPTILGDMWKFHFLYNFGGLYCDTDAFALREFPNDEWILCSGEDPNEWKALPSWNNEIEGLSLGVMKIPPKQSFLLECIEKCKKDWGNVAIFNNIYLKHFGNTSPTHDNNLFYPYKWFEAKKLFEDIQIPKDAYSIHFYGYAINREFKDTINDYNETWCRRNPNTLLGRLWHWLDN